MSTRTVVIGAVTALAVLLCDSSSAQVGGDVSEIIVTARKRQESILEVPVVTAVVTQEQLETYKMTQIRDLEARVPGLLFADAPLNNGTQVAIRGAGTSTLDGGVDQTIALNLDGMQLSQGVAYRSGLFDVGQVEILKGPQALFYGKSTTGGVISVRSADPTDKVELIGRGTYGFETNEQRGELIVSGPFSEQVLGRLAASYSRDDGYFRNTAVALPGTGAATPTTKDVRSKNLIVRGTLLFKPSAHFSGRLKLNHTHDKTFGNGGEGQWVSCPDGVSNAPALIPFLGGSEDCKLDRNANYVWADTAAFPAVTRDGIPGSFARQNFGSLELNYDPSPSIALTSVTGYYRLKTVGILNGLQTTFAGAPFFAGGGAFKRRDLTEELRLDTRLDGPLNFSGGLFYQDGSVSNELATPANTVYGLPALLGAPGEHGTDIKAYSAFGQLRYKVTPQVEIAAGARWTDDKREYEAFTFGASGEKVVLPVSVNKLKSNNVSPELTLTWEPTHDLTVFGSLKQAYKSGSFTAAGLPREGEDPSFSEERARGGEIGTKGRLADRQVTFDVAAYYYKYKDLQVSGIDQPQPGEVRTPGSRVLNAAGAKVYGVDLAINYSPAQLKALAVHAAVNYNHGRFTKFNNAPCWGGQSIEEGCDQISDPVSGAFVAQDLSGGRLLRAPDWQINAGFDYTFDLSSALDLTISSDSRYSTKYLNALAYRFDTFTRSYFMTDLTLTLGNKNDAWQVALGGRNLTNKLVATTCSTVNLEGGAFLLPQRTGLPASAGRGPAGIDELSCIINPGRQVWVSFAVKARGL